MKLRIKHKRKKIIFFPFLEGEDLGCGAVATWGSVGATGVFVAIDGSYRSEGPAGWVRRPGALKDQ